MHSFELIQKKFEAIGARLKVHGLSPREVLRSHRRISLDVNSDRKGEFFSIVLNNDPLEINVVDCKPRDRHLLLLVKSGETQAALSDRANWFKFLCGHDERHWFIAGVDPVAADVVRAKEMLKPAVVIDSVVRHKVSTRDRDRRKNAAFIRQGEWFFVPVPGLDVNENLVLLKEPLLRGFGSKPHVVDQIFRRGGVTVHVCRRFPDGLTKGQYRELIRSEPQAKKLPWQVMSREPEVFARGCVRHPDHNTVVLNDWHRVSLSDERGGAGMVTSVFLD